MNNNFIKISSEYLPTIDVTLEAYEHARTGAMHYHFSSSKEENVFMVALRTMPTNSTGVAHILEHTALCGSKNFPVRDPFFSMLRRSLQTFMNAFTSSDWTAYPFATENKQDFHNLLQIYLDAVFFPNLNKLDFLQEWHRFDFDEKNNLVLKGVVYNEMKGVYGSVYSRLYEINKSLVHPETTYHYDSGGAPQVIPTLSYEEFLAFHKKHYHPTNATFFTFGNISAAEHQENFENLALKFFDGKGEKVTTEDETKYLSPVRQVVGYPSSDTENPNQVHILLSWLLGPAHNARNHLVQGILYSYLLRHSGSPLRYALENAEFSASVSPLTMLDDSGREITLTTGIITNDAKFADETEKLVFEIFEKIISEGIDPDEATGIIDQMEVSLRELGTGYPYGLSLMLQAIGAATHDEKISEMLDPSHLLEEMRENVKDRFYLSKILEENFVKNPHFTRLTAVPDANAVAEELKIEKNFLEKTAEKLSETEKSQIREDVKNLEIRQKTPDNVDILPKISVSDIAREGRKSPERIVKNDKNISYEVATNKLWYVQKIFSLSDFTETEIYDFAIMSGLFGELGFGENSYNETQKILSQKMNLSGSFRIFVPYRENKIRAVFQVGSRFLMRNMADAVALQNEYISGIRFDEVSQMRNIFSEKLLTLKTSLTDNGHKTAMLRANSGSTAQSHLAEELGGIASIENLKNFVAKTDAEITETLEKIYQKTTKFLPTQVLIGKNIVAEEIPTSEKTPENSEKFSFTPKKINEAWLSDLNVGYCALSLRVVPVHHEDAPLFTLLAQFLKDGFLHSAIREQGGAYGSGAMYDASSENFTFFSYRDPRIEGTFADFENSIKWFLENDHATERLDEAKIGVIARSDAPSSPATEALADIFSQMTGFTKEIRDEKRKIILDATIADLKRVAKAYLTDFSTANRVVITGKQNQEIVEKMNFEVRFLD